jgi:hypothetical protein
MSSQKPPQKPQLKARCRSWAPGTRPTGNADAPSVKNKQFANLKLAIEIVDLPIKKGDFP